MSSETVRRPWRIALLTAAALLLGVCAADIVRAQSSSYAPFILKPPIVDTIDDNHVSMITGKEQFTIPALKMGDVSFTPFSVDGHFGGIMDENYGRIAVCVQEDSSDGYSDCTAASSGIQAIYGQQRATFDMNSPGQYTPQGFDGSTFVDNGSTCTWTQRDGTQIVYAAYHVSGDYRCYSNNILQVIHPDGRISTYYYYGGAGAFSQTYDTPTPIISIATNSGYMLKYNYPGTPSWGNETSVVAINRAFVACDPAAVSCTLAGTWPTATLTLKSLGVSTSDLSVPIETLTIQDEAGRRYVFGLDGQERVAWYQPPEATSPVYYYTLCTLQSNETQGGQTPITTCWGSGSWPPPAGTPGPEVTVMGMSFDLVVSVSRNGQTWNYGRSFILNDAPGWSTWEHWVGNPLNPNQQWLVASGNASPGMESYYGPIDNLTLYDDGTDGTAGTVVHYERNTQNDVSSEQTPGGMLTQYSYDFRGNLLVVTKTPSSGSGEIAQSATYPQSCTSSASCEFCTNIVTCNKPTSTTDANGNTWNYTYDPTHGGMLTATGPAVAVNGGQAQHPQTRYTYLQRNAWYLSSSGVMTEDPNPIWLLASESYCMTGAPSGSGCAAANDEVVTTYDYGPSSGPNNLLLRGKAITAQGQTQRVCYGHDPQGDKIWQTSPNANPTSCLSY